MLTYSSFVQVKKEKNKRKKDITFKGRYSSPEEKKIIKFEIRKCNDSCLLKEEKERKSVAPLIYFCA